MLTIPDLFHIATAISYKDWSLIVTFKRGDRDHPYLQWQFEAPDTDTGEVSTQYGRKWMLSYHMTKQEIVRTAYLALRQAVLHEMDEAFLYKNVAIHHPHVDPDALAKIVVNRDNLVHRDE